MTIQTFAAGAALLFVICMLPVLALTIAGYREQDRYMRKTDHH